MTLQGNKRRRCSAGTIRGGGVIINNNNNNINTVDRQIDSLPFSRVCLCLFVVFIDSKERAADGSRQVCSLPQGCRRTTVRRHDVEM